MERPITTARFFRKPCQVEDLQNGTPLIKPAPFRVVRVIILPEDRYRRFQRDLMADAPFIAARTQLTGYDQRTGCFQCLLVTTRRRKDGLLVNSEGYPYVKDNFVDKGMCADFAIHDKGTGNPHVHIMLTVRPLKENGAWGAKCRKAYDLDENGQRIPDGKGGWKNHREDTTDWNDKGNVEIWRAAWAAYTNRALEAAGQPALVDHRSYKRRGIDKIPSVHLGPAASQMEKRGIRTDKGEVNRQIAADNKLLKEIKARITRLYNWSKAEAEKPEGQQPSMIDLWEAQQQLKRPDTRTGKIRALQESAALFSFLQANGIQSMQQLHEKISDMNTRYYDLRGEIVKAERRIATLTERGEMWAQYNKYKPIRKQLAKVKPEKRELFEQRHSRELILYDAAARYLKELKDSGEEITPKAWQREIDLLTAQKQVDTIDMKAMREELKAVERLRKAADQLARQGQDKSHARGPER